ncbi:MAG TPA: TIGR01777 family oxidoreductase [Acidimicrobiales bacterium]|nr:TIGR01777 family oxidoreductase [Acidimicrobiales bacterium]
MDVAITGSSGLIGSALVTALEAGGHTVRRVVRSGTSGPGRVRWSPTEGRIDTDALAGVDAVVNLAGEGISEKRWTDEQKRRIRESRTQGTRLLAEALAVLEPRPSVLLSGSGIHYYGCRGDEELTEDDDHGEGFLTEVVVDWEAATAPATDAGIRTVALRSGIVLAAEGGALAKQLPLFKLGLGGRLGDGKQWWPWIAIDDEVGAIVHLLTSEVSGPVNLTAPGVVTNADFTRTLGRVLGRPTVLPTPSLGPRLVLGKELADSLLHCSIRAVPRALLDNGYRFTQPELEGSLRHLLDR